MLFWRRPTGPPTTNLTGRHIMRPMSSSARTTPGAAKADYDKLLIGGEWAGPSSAQRMEGRSPATLEPVGSVPEALEADVDAAVAAARRAFDRGPWPTTPPEERAAVIAKFTELLSARIDEVGAIITGEMGAPTSTVQMMMWTPAAAVLDVYAQLATKFPWEETRNGMFGE